MGEREKIKKKMNKKRKTDRNLDNNTNIQYITKKHDKQIDNKMVDDVKQMCELLFPNKRIKLSTLYDLHTFTIYIEKMYKYEIHLDNITINNNNQIEFRLCFHQPYYHIDGKLYYIIDMVEKYFLNSFTIFKKTAVDEESDYQACYFRGKAQISSLFSKCQQIIYSHYEPTSLLEKIPWSILKDMTLFKWTGTSNLFELTWNIN